MIDWACLPKPNDFANLPEYFLQKVRHYRSLYGESGLYSRGQALVIALSHLRDDDGKCWPEIQGVLTQLLRYNDNTRNTVRVISLPPCGALIVVQISDSSYLATIMAALSKSLIPTSTVESSLFAHQNDDMDPNTEREKQLVEEAVAEVERYLSMDRLVPSYRNAVTIACLEVRLRDFYVMHGADTRTVEDEAHARFAAAGRHPRDGLVHAVRSKCRGRRIQGADRRTQRGQLRPDPHRGVRLYAAAESARERWGRRVHVRRPRRRSSAFSSTSTGEEHCRFYPRLCCTRRSRDRSLNDGPRDLR